MPLEKSSFIIPGDAKIQAQWLGSGEKSSAASPDG